MGTGRFVDSITKKKDGGELTDEEIRQMIGGYFFISSGRL